jgi:hypothetical protein
MHSSATLPRAGILRIDPRAAISQGQNLEPQRVSGASVHVIGARWGQYGECGFLSQGWMNMGRLWKKLGRRNPMRLRVAVPTLCKERKGLDIASSGRLSVCARLVNKSHFEIAHYLCHVLPSI